MRASYDEQRESLNQFDLYHASLLISAKSVLRYFYAQVFPTHQIRKVVVIQTEDIIFVYPKKNLKYLFCKIQLLLYIILAFFILIITILFQEVP